MTTTIMILPNGDLVLTIHGVRVPNLPGIHGVRARNLPGTQANPLKANPLSHGMMTTGQVMDGIRKVASQATGPIIVRVVRSLTLITRGLSHLHIPRKLGNHIPSPGHLNQDLVVEVERSPKSGNMK